VNNTQQFFNGFRRKHASAFAHAKIAQIPHSSVFHKMQIRNALSPSIFHLYDFCRKFVSTLNLFLARPKNGHSSILFIVTNGCVSPRG